MARVLVIDDDPATRALVRDVLEPRGFEVLLAEDGYAGLRAVRGQRPDCVLLDVMMPGIDGHAVLGRIRESDGGGTVPVVMLTASSDDSQAWRAWTEVDYFMTKPIDTDELLRCLEHLLVPVGSRRFIA